MISIRLIKPLAGVGFSMPAGTVYQTSPEEAERLIYAGIAEPVVGYETAQATQNKIRRGVQGNNGTHNGAADKVGGKKLSKG
jgi:hypothetical protein